MEKVRGVWITNVDSDVLDSKQNITEAMKLLSDTGFNYVFPVVWNKGYTLYPSSRMQKDFRSEIDPKFRGRDPLAEVIDAARPLGLKVIPWFEFGFAASYEQNGGYILAEKPDWAAKDQQGRLLKKNGFEWMNAFHPDVQNFMLDLFLEVAQGYDIDGVQGDDRLPALPSEGGYDSFTRSLHHAELGTDPPSNTQDKGWLKWRANLLTNFLARLRKSIKAVNPALMISIAPSPYPFGYKEYLQDVPAWLNNQLVDLLHPQLYRRDLAAYQGLVDDLVDRFPDHLPLISPGILTKLGSYTIDPVMLWRCIQQDRFAGLRGEVLFFYEGLRANHGSVATHLQTRKYQDYVILLRGHQGEDVEAIQRQLTAKGFELGRTDGDFGPRTEEAVKAFQSANDLDPIDGIVGPQTLKVLFA
ncbi:MAG: family 10 glycosylhydrolase [Elainella sp. Prado103]|jgi:uncharacterized lipoprotein YddW (UPF0748 family)|nr:family 10 glycosylhydrolase [Elainella sp. Prado103]